MSITLSRPGSSTPPYLCPSERERRGRRPDPSRNAEKAAYRSRPRASSAAVSTASVASSAPRSGASSSIGEATVGVADAVEVPVDAAVAMGVAVGVGVEVAVGAGVAVGVAVGVGMACASGAESSVPPSSSAVERVTVVVSRGRTEALGPWTPPVLIDRSFVDGGVCKATVTYLFNSSRSINGVTSIGPINTPSTNSL